MFGIGGEWWILYLVIVGSAGSIVDTIKRGHSREVELPFVRGESLAEKQANFMETAQDQLASIYRAVPDTSIFEEHLSEIIDSLERIEKALTAKTGEAGRT
jgi:hypothetical protein